MKVFIAHTTTAAMVSFFVLFAAGCSKTDYRPDDGFQLFSISASNVESAAVTLAAANPTQVEAIVEVSFSPAGTAVFTEFVRSHTNQPVKIMVDQYENAVMFRGDFSNQVHGFDFHCASSNEAQIVADILNKSRETHGRQ